MFLCPRAYVLALLIPLFSAFGDSPELLHIYQTITNSFAEPDVHSQTVYVEQIQALNQNLRRHQLSNADLRDLKYSLGYWREVIAQRTIAQMATGMEDEDLAVAVLLLGKLKPSLDQAALLTLKSVAEREPRTKTSIGLLLADFGIRAEAEPILREWRDQRALQRLGPPPIAKIQPFTGSNLTGLDWVDGLARSMAPLTANELDRYEFLSRHSVRFWGQEIKTGDVFLYDLALPTDGPLTAFADEPAAFTHAGIFVIFKRQGRLVPAILEMHKRGNRVLPLSNLEHHVYYAESYRLRGANEGWQDRLTTEIEQIQLGASLAVDFQARPLTANGEFPDDDGERCATCVSLTERLFQRSGTPLTFVRTGLPEGAKANLRRIGLPLVENVPLPVSIARHPELQFAGIFDNGRLAENLSRELLIGDSVSPHSAGFAMAHRSLDLQKLQQTRFGELIAENRNRPYAPAAAAAFFLGTQDAIGVPVGHVSRACSEYLKNLGGKTPLRYEAVRNDPNVQTTAEKAFGASGIGNWYRP